MLTYESWSAARPEAAWALMARPERWAEWAPHVRGAWGLGEPEVEPGRQGAVRIAGMLPVPARVIDKEPGRRWSWRVGPVTLHHRVEPAGDGCRVAVDLAAPWPLERGLAYTYGPVVAWTVGRLARRAEDAH